jgi:hypothetical protein
VAIVREYTVQGDRPAAGARVIVHDDCYAGASAEELARIREDVARVIRRIDYNRQLRELEKGGKS